MTSDQNKNTVSLQPHMLGLDVYKQVSKHQVFYFDALNGVVVGKKKRCEWLW